MNAIETKSLTKQYGGARGITDVNLSVSEGEVFGFIGPNGAGKSTTIRTLLGLISPTSGSALVLGKSCAEHPEIRREVGYLPSEVFYYDRMRVSELLSYSASFYKKDCRARIAQLADAMDLDVKKRIDDLSFGNKKKVGIVQGLLHEPKLIILDEPTSGLDPLMQQRFFELIAEENRKGATVFFSSHILSEVQRLCDRVAFIKDGRIIKQEKVSVLQENSYKKFHLETKAPIGQGLQHLEGVSGFSAKENSAGFIFRGNINAMMKELAELDLRNLSITEPDLEEIFLHYYEKEE
ncbi:MAG: ABC-type multidrug transport system, ATPase component [Paenibacillaceae bacterium]|jgi:ABC-2 type transport system ATP-binding protein|nr:ABC-type multidrug transport system, ATPase component [Paenibacillaceae bacterium]